MAASLSALLGRACRRPTCFRAESGRLDVPKMSPIIAEPSPLEPNKYAELRTAEASLRSGEPHLFTKPFGRPWGVEPWLKWATIDHALTALGIPPDGEILDLGCGEGWTSIFLAESG